MVTSPEVAVDTGSALRGRRASHLDRPAEQHRAARPRFIDRSSPKLRR
jgi:hypothetical protein